MGENSVQNFSKHIEAWLVDLASRASKSTVSAYRQDIETYHRWLLDRGLSVLSSPPEDLQTFIDQMFSAGRSVASCNRAASAIKTFHRYLVETGASHRNPSSTLKRLTIIEKVPEILTVEAMIQVLDVAHERARSWTDTKHKGASLARSAAMLEAAYSSGFGVSDLVSVPLTAMNRGPLWRVRDGDGVLRDRVLNEKARDAISFWRDRVAECGDPSSKWLFHATRDSSKPISRSQVFRDFEEAGKASGIAMPFVLSPSIVRDTFGVHLLQNGMSIPECAHLLGYGEFGSLERLLGRHESRMDRASHAGWQPSLAMER